MSTSSTASTSAQAGSIRCRPAAHVLRARHHQPLARLAQQQAPLLRCAATSSTASQPSGRPMAGRQLRQQAGRDSGTRAGAGTLAQEAAPATSSFMQERMAFLREDLVHLFDERGIDAGQYDPVVEFRDPITSYNSIRGYLFNIQFLRRVFNPTFMLHGIRQTGEWELTTRWTMTMELAAARRLAPLRRYWDPRLVFTGVSIMGINPDTGKFNRHVDLWDNVENNKYFSLEAFRSVLAQAACLRRTHDLETPAFQVLKKRKAYEVRRYDAFLVAETAMASPTLPDAPSSSTDGSQAAASAPQDDLSSRQSPASTSGGSSSRTSRPGKAIGGVSGSTGAFRALARYIFGGNARNEKMKMTTPVFTSAEGRMQFVIGSAYRDEDSLPAPLDPAVACRQQPGGEFAVATFSGRGDAAQAAAQEAALRAALLADGLQADGQGWLLARYNDPSVRPVFRRNEVIIPLRDFVLW